MFKSIYLLSYEVENITVHVFVDSEGGSVSLEYERGFQVERVEQNKLSFLKLWSWIVANNSRIIFANPLKA